MTLHSVHRFIKKAVALVALFVVFFSPLSAFGQNEPTAILAASNITPNSVRLTGHVTNPENSTIAISWGKQGQAILGTNPPPGIGLTGTDNSFIYDISNLEAATTYYVAISDAVAHTTISTSPSSFTFTTAQATVNVGEEQTGGQTGIFFKKATTTDTSSTLEFLVITSGRELGLKLKYGTDQTALNTTSNEFYRGNAVGSAPATASVTINSLSPSTDYFYEVVDSNTQTSYVTGYIHTSSAGGNPITITNGVPTPSCSDGKDNDSDGKIDYPNDPDCANASSNAEGTCPDGQYCLLAPLPNIDSSVDFKGTSIGKYLNGIFKFMIGLAGVLAVVMLVLGGIQYMSTDAISGKEAGKERMTSSILGLLLALGAFVILNTISPTLTNLGLTIDKVTITIEPDEIDVDTPHAASPDGGYCLANYTSGTSVATLPGPAEETVRQTLQNSWQVYVNSSGGGTNICTTVGQQNCTSVQGFVTSGIQKLRSLCLNCELHITGGTECWLHSKKTSHGPGSPTADLSKTSSLQSFVYSDKNPITINNWGNLYVVNGIEFVDEGDHFHVWGWNGEHKSKYPTKK